MLKEQQEALRPKSEVDPTFSKSTAGRVEWQERHRVGKFRSGKNKKKATEKRSKADPRGKKRRLKAASRNVLF